MDYRYIEAFMANIQLEKNEPDSGKFFVPSVPCDTIDLSKVSDPFYLSATLRTDEIFPSDCKVITQDRNTRKISDMLKRLLAMPVTKGAASSISKSGPEHLSYLNKLVEKRDELKDTPKLQDSKIEISDYVQLNLEPIAKELHDRLNTNIQEDPGTGVKYLPAPLALNADHLHNLLMPDVYGQYLSQGWQKFEFDPKNTEVANEMKTSFEKAEVARITAQLENKDLLPKDVVQLLDDE